MRTQAPPPTRSATLGRRLRSVLVAPAAGFESAISAADRRARAGETLAEGLTPYVLAIVGGASLMIGWLKIGGLLGGRDVDPTQFGFAELTFALVTGAVLAMLGQAVFGVVAPPVVRAFGGGAEGARCAHRVGCFCIPSGLHSARATTTGSDNRRARDLCDHQTRRLSRHGMGLHLDSARVVDGRVVRVAVHPRRAGRRASRSPASHRSCNRGGNVPVAGDCRGLPDSHIGVGMKRIATAPPRAELGFVDDRALPDGRRFAPGVSGGALGRRSVREKR